MESFDSRYQALVRDGNCGPMLGLLSNTAVRQQASSSLDMARSSIKTRSNRVSSVFAHGAAITHGGEGGEPTSDSAMMAATTSSISTSDQTDSDVALHCSTIGRTVASFSAMAWHFPADVSQVSKFLPEVLLTDLHRRT